MKKFLRKYFRSPITGILLTLSMAIAFFVCVSGGKMKSMAAEPFDWYDGQYTCIAKYIIDVSNMKDEAELTNLVEYFAEYSDGVAIEEIVTAGNIALSEKIKVLMNNGDLKNFAPELSDNEIEAALKEKNVVFLGDSQMQSSYKVDGKLYFDINHKPYRVMGSLKNYSISGYDNRIVVMYQTLSDKYKKDIKEFYRYYNPRCSVTIGADSYEKINERLKAAQNELIRYKIKLTWEERNVLTLTDKRKEGINSTFLPAFIIFCAVNVFVAVRLWLVSRKREIAVFKSFGMSMTGLIIKVIAEMLKCAFTGIILGAGAELLYTVLSGSEIRAENYFNGTVGTMIIAMLAVFVVNILFYYFYIKNIPPATGIKNK